MNWDTPTGVIQLVMDILKDGRAKDCLADAARLICVGYEVTTAVIVL